MSRLAPPSPHDRYPVGQDKAGKFRFRLKVATKNGIASVRMNAANAPVVDVTE